MSHLVTAALVAVVVVLGGNLLVAPYSSEGYATLDAQRVRLEENLAELESTHAQLQSRIDLLARSSDAVRVQARRLGYYGEDETVVRLEDAPPQYESESPGTIIRGGVSHTDRRPMLRLLAVIAAGVVLVLLLLADRGSGPQPMRRPSR